MSHADAQKPKEEMDTVGRPDGALRLRAKISTERAYEAIRSAILKGRYSLGERIVEDVLAAEIGVSRTPIREALRLLAAEGVIRYGLGLGARVANWNKDELNEIMTLRVTLESLGAQLAAKRITDAQIASLEALNNAMLEISKGRSDGFLERIADTNHQFHKAIAAASHSPRLQEMIGQLLEIPLMLRTFRVYSEAELQRSFSQHQDVVSALAERDSAWAASAMSAHILSAQKSVQQSVSES